MIRNDITQKQVQELSDFKQHESFIKSLQKNMKVYIVYPIDDNMDFIPQVNEATIVKIPVFNEVKYKENPYSYTITLRTNNNFDFEVLFYKELFHFTKTSAIRYRLELLEKKFKSHELMAKLTSNDIEHQVQELNELESTEEDIGK